MAISSKEKNQAGRHTASFVLMKHLPMSCCLEVSQSCFLLGRFLGAKNTLMGIMDAWSRTKDPPFLPSFLHSFLPSLITQAGPGVSPWNQDHQAPSQGSHSSRGFDPTNRGRSDQEVKPALGLSQPQVPFLYSAGNNSTY